MRSVVFSLVSSDREDFALDLFVLTGQAVKTSEFTPSSGPFHIWSCIQTSCVLVSDGDVLTPTCLNPGAASGCPSPP